MALSSLLDIISRACDELSLDRPTVVVAATSPQVRTLLSHAQAAGRYFQREHEWTALQTVGTITTASGTSSYALASDYDRMIPDTGWNRTTTWPMVGPDTPQINRYLNESGVTSAGINQRYRLNGSNLIIWPTPTATQTLAYEYISNKWARSSGSVAQVEFLADTDTTVFDPDLMKSEIKWRFMAGKGFYGDALRTEAMALLELKKAADLGGRKMSMEPVEAVQFVGLENIPDTGFGQ